ncbi:hypothetical protein EVAR_70094_1 [Eumeta japonica]|uniref:Uncharacterized protein n=1 Tax=Eumeta variegata TaxID=151549 RepID=A0A4C2A3N3_EUMVA|nr:hypothetical protein EVAR_70094_1 [Eumeta japonica]
MTLHLKRCHGDLFGAPRQRALVSSPRASTDASNVPLLCPTNVYSKGILLDDGRHNAALLLRSPPVDLSDGCPYLCRRTAFVTAGRVNTRLKGAYTLAPDNGRTAQNLLAAVHFHERCVKREIRARTAARQMDGTCSLGFTTCELLRRPPPPAPAVTPSNADTSRGLLGSRGRVLRAYMSRFTTPYVLKF